MSHYLVKNDNKIFKAAENKIFVFLTATDIIRWSQFTIGVDEERVVDWTDEFNYFSIYQNVLTYQPFYEPAYFNGHNAVMFAGNQFLQGEIGKIFNSTTDNYSILIVMKADIGGSFGILTHGSIQYSPNPLFIDMPDTDYIRFNPGSGNTANYITSTTPVTAEVAVWRFDSFITESYSAIRRNGLVERQGSFSIFRNANLYPFRLGCWQAGPSNPAPTRMWHGQMYDIIILRNPTFSQAGYFEQLLISQYI